jgi:hypothetical protein
MVAERLPLFFVLTKKKTDRPLKNSPLECPWVGSPTNGCSVFVLY